MSSNHVARTGFRSSERGEFSEYPAVLAVLVAMIPLAVLRVWRFGGCAHARGGELLAIPIEARAGAIKASD